MESWEQIVGTNRSTLAPMDTQPRRRIPTIQFRVLIIGRANAGKTSILQRVCDTMESAIIYRGDKEVRGPTILFASLISPPTNLG
jgi:GTP-binding protein EngB required for normal cell division